MYSMYIYTHTHTHTCMIYKYIIMFHKEQYKVLKFLITIITFTVARTRLA